LFTFRSPVAGLILVASLVTANLVAFAYMAVNKIGIDINVLPVSAVGIGVGVDYGIYLLTRIRDEYELTGDLKQSIITGMGTSGRAILFTALILSLSVIIWYFSELKFQAEMGFLLGFLLICNMLGALLFVPAMVYAIKPRFITKLRTD
jgi:predicted RND superfamily exporter protein